MRNKVSFLLTTTLLIMSLIPFAAALFFARDAFTSQERIYKNGNLNQVLRTTQDRLKEMSKISPKREKDFKNLFEEIQDLKLIYGEDTFFSDKLNGTLLKYFFVTFGAYLIFALIIGVYLSGLIHRIYKVSHQEMLDQKDKARYLEEIARWQDVAKKMAHEIRRPLQPIKMWISNLKSAYSAEGKKEYNSLLQEADQAISEELLILKRMVDEFSEFADLPRPKKERTELNEFLKIFSEQYKNVWETATVVCKLQQQEVYCYIDPGLSRQVLINLIENAVEANPFQKINVELSLRMDSSHFWIDVFNTGAVLDETQRNKIFDLNFSTKRNSKNRGLGLSISKFIVIEQGGDLQCVEEIRGARFRIQTPISAKGKNATY